MRKKVFRVDVRIQLAHFLQEKVGGSIKGIRRSLEKNCCKVNDQIERFGSVWLEKGSVVEFTPPQEQTIKWTTLFENKNLLIVNKPVNWVCSQPNCARTFGKNIFLVHRLDKDTTGALLLAKSLKVKEELIELFAAHEIEKEYIALVDGVVRKEQGVIDNFLAKKGSFEGQTIWGASKRGLRAITHFKVLKRGLKETLLSCKPITGRTHQIRVHMAEMGHPILIDRQYAKSFRSKVSASRPLLHAHLLRFVFRGEEISVTSPLPKDFP